MKEVDQVLEIFCFSSPVLMTEWQSLLGSKYDQVLPFRWHTTLDYEKAQVVIWDGVITPKNERIVSKLIEDLKSSKVLLLMGEALTMFHNHLTVKVLDTSGIRYVEIAGWNVLPEEILAALEECYKKIKDV